MTQPEAPGITDIRPFKEIIRESCGLVFDEVRQTSLAAAVGARMSARGVSTGGAYLELVRGDRKELNLLINHVTVNETYFYREPSHLGIVAGRLIPGILEQKGKTGKIKIVSAGCSTGEEPYSLMIAVAEKYGAGAAQWVSVIGFDIDERALARAREGVFTEYSFRSFPARLRDRYFEETGNGTYRIKQFIKKAVSFERVNLLAAAYPPSISGADIIFYRNVSIYFEPGTQKEVFGKLAGLLGGRGYIFLGSAETYFHDIGVLALREMDGSFLYVKEPCATTLDINRGKEICAAGKFPPAVVPGAAPRQVAATMEHSQRAGTQARSLRPDELFGCALSLAGEKRYGKALEHIDALLEMDPSFVKAHTLKAGIMLDSGDLKGAEAACLKAVALDRWCLEAHLLEALMAKSLGDADRALKKFREAVYIRPSCWLAHLYLGDIYRDGANMKKACREYEIVKNLLSNGGFPDHGLTLFNLPFTAAQVVQLCRHNLSALGESGRWQ